MDYSVSREFRTPLYNYSITTKTIEEQNKIEDLVNDTFYQKKDDFKTDYRKLFKPIHMAFSKSKLIDLPESYESLDASQAWLIYWTLHSLKLLKYSVSDHIKDGIIQEIKCCQSPTGGFGGGAYQLAHLATSYASILALVELESDEALSVINKQGLYSWLMSLRNEEGAFAMHEGGELDVRGCYCAVTIATVAGIVTEELFAGTAQWVASCQTYEGGFGGTPGLEAHGGYSFCGMACLDLLGEAQRADLPLLLHWTVCRQMAAEGGFQGRTNKLVDSCYSFWVGALVPLVQRHLPHASQRPLHDPGALEEYILVCCQNLAGPVHNPSGGGLIDKPGKHADPYHTCYSLSGLAVLQHYRQKTTAGQGDAGIDLEPVNTLFNVTCIAAARVGLADPL